MILTYNFLFSHYSCQVSHQDYTGPTEWVWNYSFFLYFLEEFCETRMRDFKYLVELFRKTHWDWCFLCGKIFNYCSISLLVVELFRLSISLGTSFSQLHFFLRIFLFLCHSLNWKNPYLLPRGFYLLNLRQIILNLPSSLWNSSLLYVGICISTVWAAGSRICDQKWLKQQSIFTNACEQSKGRQFQGWSSGTIMSLGTQTLSPCSSHPQHIGLLFTWSLL